MTTPYRGHPDRLAEIKQRAQRDEQKNRRHNAAVILPWVGAALDDRSYLIGEVERLRADHPARSDVVATWLKTLRDQHVPNSYQWEALDSALEDYRLRADYGLSLTASTEGVDGPASPVLPAAPDRGGE